MHLLAQIGLSMDAGENTPSEQQEEPFWSSAQAPESTTPIQPEAQTASPTQSVPQIASSIQPEAQIASPTQSVPQGQIMGQLGQQPQTHFSATVNNPAQGTYIGSSPSITSGYDMTEKKKGMNWKQFAIGFFAPILILIVLSFISEFTDGDWEGRWDDVHRMEMVTMSSDNGTFTHTFSEEITDYGRFEVNWCNSMNWEDEYEYHCDWDYNSEGDKDIIEVPNNDRESRVVGEYTQINRTIWFSTDSNSIDEIEFEFEFIDRALEDELNDSGGGDMVDTFFCLMPLAGIVAVVISFARGNKSLGYGLLTAASIPILLGGLMLALLLMFGF